MRVSYGKRILMFFHWLFSLLIFIALALCAIAPDFMRNGASRVGGSLGRTGAWIAGIVCMVFYLALSVFQLLIILDKKKRGEKGFITVDSSDNGKVRIAVSAIEQMVRQSVRSINGISEMTIHIDNADDAISIAVNAVIVSGSHVPSITTNMQRSIRQFVEVHCGVAVRSVSVSIDAVSSQAEAAHRRFLGRIKPEGEKRPAQAQPTDEIKAVDARDTVLPEVSANPEFSEEYPPKAVEYGDGAQSAGPEVQIQPIACDSAEGDAVPTEDSAPVAGKSAPSAYDFDKPYESEFAKDLAEMRAREAAGKAGSEDV